MPSVAERVFTIAALVGSTPGPALRAALLEGADLIRQEWIEGGRDHSDQGDYLRALQDESALNYPYLGDVYAMAVVNPTPQAEWIEEGRSGFHLPTHWGRGGGQWKVGKHGNRYAYVPFRHRTPVTVGGGSTSGRARMAMPAKVYSLARQLEDGGRLSVGALSAALEGRTPADQRVGEDLYKQSKSYTYYREIFGDDVPDHLPGGYTWKASPYDNLTRHTAETPGGGRHTEYMTFRTITPDSPGWFIPAQPAYHVAAEALDRAAPQIQALLDAAAAADAAQAIVDAMRGIFE